MSEEAGKTEPIEDGIANVIQKALEPFVVRLEAAAVSLQVATYLGRLNLADDLDVERATIEKAVGIALHVLSAARGGVEFNRELHIAREREMTECASGSWLVCEAKSNDDSFREYLKKVDAPDFILKRGFKAHRDALLKHNLLINDGTMKDGKEVFSLRPAWADKYLQAERAAKAKAAKRRRNKDA